MIEAIIFDMDGVLVDSEPLWRKAEVRVFGEAGLRLTEDDCKTTMGLRLDEVVRTRLPGLAAGARAAVEVAIMDGVIDLVRRTGEAKPGATQAVTAAVARGLPVGLASSSPLRLIEATLERIGLAGAFRVVHSAEHEPYGKPHPAVYITAAERLGARPEACLAIEDSLRGLISAKAASMRCLLVPEEPDPRHALADLVLPSLDDLDDAAWSRLLA
ncbi:MAG: hexitol phosphatase HxpB [Polyangiaceae bacterium]